MWWLPLATLASALASPWDIDYGTLGEGRLILRGGVLGHLDEKGHLSEPPKAPCKLDSPSSTWLEGDQAVHWTPTQAVRWRWSNGAWGPAACEPPTPVPKLPLQKWLDQRQTELGMTEGPKESGCVAIPEGPLLGGFSWGIDCGEVWGGLVGLVRTKGKASVFTSVLAPPDHQAEVHRSGDDFQVIWQHGNPLVAHTENRFQWNDKSQRFQKIGSKEVPSEAVAAWSSALEASKTDAEALRRFYEAYGEPLTDAEKASQTLGEVYVLALATELLPRWRAGETEYVVWRARTAAKHPVGRCDTRKTSAEHRQNGAMVIEGSPPICLSSNSASVEAVDNLGLFLFEGGYSAEAVPFLAAAVLASPERTTARLNLADALWALERQDEARPHYKTFAEQLLAAGKKLNIPERVAKRSRP